MLNKIFNFIKPTLDYDSEDQRRLIQKNFSSDPNYIIFVCFVVQRRKYYVKYHKTVKQYRFYNRKTLTPINLEYRFQKGKGFGEPYFIEETSNYKRALLTVCKEDCCLTNERLFDKYAAQLRQLNFSKF